MARCHARERTLDYSWLPKARHDGAMCAALRLALKVLSHLVIVSAGRESWSRQSSSRGEKGERTRYAARAFGRANRLDAYRNTCNGRNEKSIGDRHAHRGC